MLTEIYPVSLPALMNRLEVPVKGRFQYELTEKEIRSAKFVLMDIHWYTSMAYGIFLSRKIRRINPEAIIISGGITATLFARQILRDSEIDYIIRGDAEIPVYSNVSAQPVQQKDQIRDLLLKQLTSPVLWMNIIENMIEDDCSEFFEVGPGKVLSGLNRRINRTVQCIPVGDIGGVEKITG